MRVLILHRIDYSKIRYHIGIDHAAHDVFYVGTEDKLTTLPPELRCQKLLRPERGDHVCESVLAALEGRPQSFDRIISLSEYELLEAAKLRDHLGVPGPSYADTLLVRDKIAMKQAMDEAGIHAPRYVPLKSVQEGRLTVPWTGKTVLKPTHGAGSEDVVIFETSAACLEAIESRTSGVQALDCEAPQVGGFEIEEYVAGEIVHFDGLVSGARVVAALGSRYLGTCEQYVHNHPLGSYQIELDAARMDWVQRVVSATHIRDGAFHLEAFEADGGLVFLEIANRSGGAGVPQATTLAWGADFQQLELELLLGECRSDLAALSQRDHYYGWYVLPGHSYAHGQWIAPGGLEPFRSDPRVVHWYERPATDSFDTNPDYPLQALPFGGIVGAKQSNQVQQYMVELFAALRWRLHAR